MKIIADLHVHSKYSRACSKDLTLPNIAAWCGKKGITLVGTGDFTHPAWFREMADQLELQENGFYSLRSLPLPEGEREGAGASIRRHPTQPPLEEGRSSPVFFVPTAEVSCIYTRGGRGRRVHHILVAPTLPVVKKINTRLAAIGNVVHDGRPILGLDSEELAKIVFDASPECMIIPAHAWTPWFGLLGSKSGFDSLEECFGTMTPYIYAIESGLSSNPAMNSRLSALDPIAIVSFSDAHSLANLGREATVFDLPAASYAGLVHALRTRERISTIEFFPEEGKYHSDGHRLCGVRMTPTETKKQHGVCPKCKKQVTVGVLNRIDALADRAEKSRQAFTNIVPLQEIIADAYGVGKQSKRVQRAYERLVTECANEFSLLLDVPYDAMMAHADSPLIIEGIRRVREGRLHIEPGYDGEYGTIRVVSDDERSISKQQSLL